MAFETRSGMPYIPYYEDPNFQLSYPPAAYRKGLADFAQMKADDADRMRRAMQSNLPSSLDYFDDDPTRIIQNQFQQYRDREPIPEPTRPVSVRPPSLAVQSRQMAGHWSVHPKQACSLSICESTTSSTKPCKNTSVTRNGKGKHCCTDACQTTDFCSSSSVCTC